MRKLTLTIRKPNDSPREWQQLSFDIMKLLKTRYEFLDDQCLCNVSIKEYLENWSTPEKAVRHLRDLTVFLMGADWPAHVEYIGELILVGDQYDKGTTDYCSNCGSDDYTYYSDNMMYCSTCDTQHYIDDEYQADDFDLFGKINSILKP